MRKSKSNPADGGQDVGAGTTPPRKRVTARTSKKVDLYVVVAADDLDDQKLIAKAVKDCHVNHMVTSVYNGLQLMNLLLGKGFYKIEFKRRPDVIILDLKIPLMDGYEVLEELKKYPDLSGIPVFVLSDASPDMERRPLETPGGNRFFSKPFSNEELRHLTQEICTLALKK